MKSQLKCRTLMFHCVKLIKLTKNKSNKITKKTREQTKHVEFEVSYT